MTKVAYNACYGGFGLSDAAFEALLDRKKIAWVKADSGSSIMGCNYRKKDSPNDAHDLCRGDFEKDRCDPDLIAVIEELGDRANGMCAKLRIEEVPEGTSYRIDEYDGNERVMTRDDYDWKTA